MTAKNKQVIGKQNQDSAFGIQNENNGPRWQYENWGWRVVRWKALHFSMIGILIIEI